MNNKDFFTVDWSTAPDWAIFHHYDNKGQGFWKGVMPHPVNNYFASIWERSGYMLLNISNWQDSVTIRPESTKKTGKILPYNFKL